MPLIQSKKYKTESFVTVEVWKIMQEKGLSRRFRIVDDGDIQDTVIETPASFTDFSRPVVHDIIEEPESVPSREELKEWLTDNEVEFNNRASTDNLYQLYLNNCK